MYAMMEKFERSNEANRKKKCCKQPNPTPKTPPPPFPQEAKNDTGCFCQRPLRSLKPQDVDLFLPRCLPCTCDRHTGVKTCSRRPIALESILRPWQVRFLRHEYLISSAPDLVSSYNRIGPVMAKGMKEWWTKSFKFASSQDIQSCELALMIWTRTCQMIMDSSNSSDTVYLYEVEARESACQKQKTGSMDSSSVPMIIRIPAGDAVDDVSACSSQGATTVLEDFLEQLFTQSYFEQDDGDVHLLETNTLDSEPGATEKKDWDSDTLPTAVEPVFEISNMDDVMVSIEFYKCMDTKTMTKKDQELHAAKMSSVLNQMDIHLITKKSPPRADSKSAISGEVASKPAMVESTVDTGTETTQSITKSANFIAEEKETTSSSVKKQRAKRMVNPRKQKQWHCSLNYLATFDG